jgi:hypothetical protein
MRRVVARSGAGCVLRRHLAAFTTLRCSQAVRIYRK